MGNLSTKERVLTVAVVLILLIAIVAMFIIRPLNNKYTEMEATYNELLAQKDYYEQLKANNANSQSTISDLDNSIEEQELTFLPEINTESIEQYVMSVFEENGNPYLVSISSETVPQDQIALSDGSYSSETLLLERVTATYATTDGYCVYQANGEPSYGRNGEIDADAINEAISNMGTYDIVGYDEFIAAVNVLASVDPDTVKINDVTMEDTEAGYNLLTVVVDFYATSLTQRVSTPDTSAPYVSWNGNTDTDTAGGLIGTPILVTNPDSEWYGTQNMSSDMLNFADRPFATYFSSAIFSQVVNSGSAYETDGTPSAELGSITFSADGATTPAADTAADADTETADEA